MMGKNGYLQKKLDTYMIKNKFLMETNYEMSRTFKKKFQIRNLDITKLEL